MRVSVDIAPELLERLRAESVRRGVSVNALTDTVIRSGLSALITERSAPPLGAAVSMGAPRVDLTHALQVADALEDEERLRALQRGT